MPAIDINRLRRFHSDASAAHAALVAQGAKVRHAREDLARARTNLDRAQHPIPGVRRVDEDAEKPLQAAVKAAEGAMKRAEDDNERLERAWEHAARLRTRVRQYAIEQGALPDDLREI
jgi:DNA repair ATPase RecN